jgi:cytoskeletal protein CcmA (bactofilin family)
MKETNEKIDLTIGEITIINGNLNSKGSVRIDGKVKGDITCDGMIIIGEKGNIEGNINAAQGIIGGKVNGNIITKDYLELNGTSTLTGDVDTNIFQIDKGAVFNGNCIMGKNKEQKPKK